MTKQAVVDEPVPSLENGNDTDDKSSIWASILRDVKSSTKKAPATKSLVVLGDNESGRTTLVAKLQGNDDPKRGAGLEYHYIDVKDDDRDDTPKLGVWILDGDVACSAPLLKFAIKPETLENTIVILVASMTQPWSLLSTLKKWTTLIEEHIDRLKIDPTRLRELRDHLQYDFQHYIEPNDSSVMLTSSTTIKSGMGGGRVPNSVSSVSLASTTPLDPTNGEEQIVIPLADGVLTKSLGIQIIVVITKCDVMSILEKENDYKDESFDFMQHHLRKFCLEYGAALFYTSVKEKKNIDKLYKYIVHKCYGYPFTYSAAIVERDAIFIPYGWDNPKKADILLENLHRLKSTDNYSDVFVKPIVRRPLQRDNEVITAEDDQEFLSKLQSTIHRPVSPDENGIPGPNRAPGSIVSQTPSNAAQKQKSSNVSTGDPNQRNEGALANFFNSLLTKKSCGAVTPTSASTPTTQRQTSQSPTTPSSKRLQQHPLTFAVTPPPGRTKTPTSLKTFPSSSNVDSPPKLLSPVVEQQPKIETTSSSHSLTTVRTPVEDSEPVTNLDVTEDKQSNDVLQLENDPNLNVNQQNIEPVISQHDSVSNTINNSNNETFDSPSRSSSLIEDKSNVVQTAPTDDSHRRLSNDFSLSSPSQPDEHSNTEHQEIFSSKNESRSTSPVVNDSNKQLDRSPSIDHKSPRLLSSPTLENTQQSNDKEESENQRSAIVSPEEAPTYPIQDISLNNNSEEQQDNSKQSLNSSRRNSAINSSIPSRPLTPISNEPQQQEDKTLLSPVNIIQTLPGDAPADLHSENELSNEILRSEKIDRRPSSSDVQQVEVPDENSLTHQSSRLLSTLNVNTSEEEQHDQTFITVSNTNNNQKYLNSPVEMSEDNPTLHSTENINSSSATENHNSLKSPNIDHHPSSLTNCRPDDPIFIDDNLQKSPINETVLSPENSEPTKLIGSPTIESGDTKFDSYENTTAPSITEGKKIRSRSPSPTIEREQERSRSPSPTIEKQQDRSRSPSPITEQKLEQSESSLPFHEQKQKRSRYPSPTPKKEQDQSRPVSPVTEQKQERSRSPSPTIKREKDRSRSPSPTVKREQDRSRSPSPTVKQEQDRSRSPSPTVKREQDRSRSPSPTVKQEQDRSRSPSPTVKREKDRSRSQSPITEQKQERSQSSSPINEEKQQKSRSPSPNVKQGQDRSRSPSPITEQKLEQNESALHFDEQKQQRSRSPSPTIKQEQERSRPVSPSAEQDHERSQSPSPIIKKEQDRSRSPSPITEQKLEENESPLHFDEQKQQRSRSPSSITEQKDERSQSPSPINEEKQQRSRSPSPTIKQEQDRSRSPSPITEQKLEQSESPLHFDEQKQQRSRSPSPTIKQEQERSRPVSPSAEQDHERSRTSSPNIQQERQRSRSQSPIIKQKQERSQSPSPINEEKQQRSRSPSPTIKQGQEGSRSLSPAIEQEKEKSRSSSPTIEQNKERSRSPSLNLEHKHEQSPPKSPITGQNPERSRSLSPNKEHNEQSSPSSSSNVERNSQNNQSTSVNIEQKQERSRSPSPNAQQNQQKSRSPSPVVQEKEERSRSPSPVIEQKEQRSRSPSVSIEQNQERNRSSSPNAEQKEARSQSLTSLPLDEQKEKRSRSPSPISELEQQPNRFPSPMNEQNQQRSRSSSPITEHKEQRSRSPSPNIDQQIERRGSSSSIHEDQRKDSFSFESLENKSDILASPKLEENKSPRLSTDGNYNTMNHLEENVATSPMIETKEEDHDRFPSSTNSEKHNQDHENVLTSSTPVTDKNEQLKKSPLSSPLTEKRVEESLLVPSPIDQQEISIVQNKNENKISPLASPLTAPVTENHSSQALKSPVNENVSSSILEKQEKIPPISTINPKQRNLSHSSTKHSSVDHHHEQNASPISIPPVGHQSSITRSQSQSTITRPNTLPFSPNNHDLDGLYTSNDYNDEDEILDDGEHHHNSAPSTVSVEYRRFSLLHNTSVDQNHTSVDPNDISRRLSIVEKSRVEDNDNNDADSTNSKDT